MNSEAIKVSQLTFSYDQKHSLFKNLDMQLQMGNIYGLLGKNGAGKTTLLRILSGLLYSREGRVEVIGHEPGARSPELLSDIFFLPEEFYLPALSALQYQALYAPFYPKFDGQQFLQHLKEFQIDVQQKLSALSYGQKKKFFLAFGLASNAALCILDEPTNGLDIPSKSQFRRVVAASVNEERMFLISTHQVRDMELLIDPVIIIDDARIIFQREYSEISKRLSIEKVNELPIGKAVLFSQEELGGYRIVTEKTEADESVIDMETLFNAVIENPDAVNNVFKEDN
ncbi:MAG: ABC transporter ATP-binding protein [Spirochaetaceae bacterium]|nr:ABC transporter ATP-binding protein [Spirochaetaceae bacterium]MCF7948526.1 ABC transporter ATP-binding protein [Spirochaetia bacterium]MCF7951004.1 ABC transporter ATP-binding protein [Spirochaetaceae bacterium]